MHMHMCMGAHAQPPRQRGASVSEPTMSQRDSTGSTVLEARGISKSYGAVQALDGVDLELRRGEVLGLVGDNGAGKTTLVKCLSGVHRPDAGSILIDGRDHGALTAEGARTLGIETVYQNLSLVDTLDVMQNFFLNRELVYRNPVARALGLMNKRRMYRDTSAHLTELGLQVEARRQISALSGGQRQMIAVGRAITWGRHIVMLDEPAAALGVRQSMQVLQFVRTMAERGVAVLFISHNMQHVFQATDRIVVLRHGQKVGDLATKEATAQEIVTLITGSELTVAGQDFAV
jgi:ABC-type sugar transport system ATPase subunit